MDINKKIQFRIKERIEILAHAVSEANKESTDQTKTETERKLHLNTLYEARARRNELIELQRFIQQEETESR